MLLKKDIYRHDIRSNDRIFFSFMCIKSTLNAKNFMARNSKLIFGFVDKKAKNELTSHCKTVDNYVDNVEIFKKRHEFQLSDKRPRA